MEFSNRGGQQPAAPGQPAQHHAPAGQGRRKFAGSKAMRIVSVVLLVSAALLVAALAVYLGTGGSKAEGEYIDKAKYQAVFLNGGQVYFGKIGDLNSKFVTLSQIYYLRVNQQVQPNQSTDQSQQNVSLAKLGCELHGPQDKMVINREQVTFWENLKDDGQVVKAITEYRKANPQDQKCETSGAANSSSSTTATPTPTPAATPTPTPSTTTKKP